MKTPLQTRNNAKAFQMDPARTVTQKRGLADKRPEAVAQRKLAEMMNNSPRVLQQRALSDALHNSPRMVAQREEKPNNTGLPNQLKSGIESLSGMSMDHVKVHYNSHKPAQLQAHAYAQGSDIHLGTGQEKHLPHEAWHVVQQAQGRVRPTLQMKAGALNDDPALEKEADMMGEKAAQLKGDHAARKLVSEERVAGAATQRAAVASTVVLQRRTNFAEQRDIAVAAERIIDLTAPLPVAQLTDRISFNAGAAGFLARVAGFAALRNDAERVQNDFGNILAFVTANDYSNYRFDGLDGVLAKLTTDLAEIGAVRSANNKAAVDASKAAMLTPVAKKPLWEKARGYTGHAFGNAVSKPLAQAALDAWELGYFTLDRSQLMAAAKRQIAVNGGKDNATVWSITPDINGYKTHMTVYNNDIGVVGPVFVTSATDRTNSDAAANAILANGAGTTGIHLTLEVHPHPAPNPRVFGNPPAVARHSITAPPVGIGWNDFVGPLTNAQNAVREDVWTKVNEKLQGRPAP